jgi:hypothetical protein
MRDKRANDNQQRLVDRHDGGVDKSLSMALGHDDKIAGVILPSVRFPTQGFLDIRRGESPSLENATSPHAERVSNKLVEDSGI